MIVEVPHKKIIANKKIEQIVFCGDDQSFKTIIAQFQNISSATEMLVHSAGSKSAVGSNNKNTKGKFISFLEDD